MDFAAEIDDKNNTIHYLHDLVSARWVLLIRVRRKIVGDLYISYNKLKFGKPHLLNISVVATKEYLRGEIGEEIMDAIKERGEVRFGSRLFLTDCRKETETSTMRYDCEEAKLRFEPGSDQIKATLFGNHPTCIINLLN